MFHRGDGHLTRARSMNDLVGVTTPAPPSQRDILPFPSANLVWADRVAKSADRLAFRYPSGGKWLDLTWKQADTQVREIAAGLISLGIRSQDRVGLLAQTRLEWMLADLGTLLAGAAVVPIYASSTAEQSVYVLRDSGARAVFVEDAAQLEKLLPQLLTGADLHLIHIDGDAKLEKPDARGRTQVALADVLRGVPREASRRVLSWQALQQAGRTWLDSGNNAAELERRRTAPGPGDTFTIIYTSGTTGNPKGVVLTHENLVSGCASACRGLTLNEGDLHYLWLTLAHVLAREIAWASLFTGVPIVFSEGLPKIKDNLVQIRPTFMAGVPRIYEKFYAGVQAGMNQGSGVKKSLVNWARGVGQRHSAEVRAGRTPGGWLAFQHRLADKLVFSKLRAKLGLDRCRFLISGGAPLSAEIAEFFHSTGILILEGYGLTETTAAAFLNRLDQYRFGTVGPALDVVEAKIADDGEILMRGPSVFKRYHNNAGATAQAIDAEGWLHSGDIGHLEDGFLRITDRKKDLIVLAGGKKVAPQMLENALKARCPLVSQVLVYGDRKPYCVALVTLAEETVKKYGEGDAAKAADNAELNAAIKQAVDAVNATVANFETIKNFRILSEDFTEQNGQLTPSLKVKRKIATDRHRPAIEGLYSGASAD
jgi:long-chain acyl-CoA synthetase